jgi:hypothetical protein
MTDPRVDFERKALLSRLSEIFPNAPFAWATRSRQIATSSTVAT